MDNLDLVGLSEDRKRLILASSEGHEFTLPVDDRLRAALRGDRARLGQLEIEMESALRPRDIQARIRAGQAPEAVAEVAQVPLDRIMGYAVPVLAERQHMAENAQRAALRRKGGEGSGRTLGAVVGERLRTLPGDAGSTGWDAWRRDDGKWTVEVSFGPVEDRRVALFAFDPLGRYTVPVDDEAGWLAGEPSDAATPDEPGTPGRRLSAVPPGHGTGADEEATADLTAVADAVQSRRANEPEQAERDESDPETAPTAPTDEPPAEGKPEKKRSRRGRASMPSWDEIMFGRENRD